MVVPLDGMINIRYHCGEEMDYLGENNQGHGFGCKFCDVIEYSIDPTKPTTPEERPRKSMLTFGYETKIGQ